VRNAGKKQKKKFLMSGIGILIPDEKRAVIDGQIESKELSGRHFLPNGVP
jgi:hypothetical protein